MQVVNEVENEFMKKKIPTIDIGDQVEVSSKIIEGDKERVQKFIGTVIAKKGSGTKANFTVRRIVQGEGAERIFPIHSPNLKKVKVIKSSKVRRAKLYYLRERTGKDTRLKEKFTKSNEETAKKTATKAKKTKKTTTKTTTKAKKQEPEK